MLERLLVGRQCFLSACCVLDNGPRVSILLSLSTGTSLIWLVDSLALDIAQLRNPMANVLAVRIESLALSERVEDPEIGLWIDTCAGGKSPTAVIRGKVPVDEILHEVFLAESPVQ